MQLFVYGREEGNIPGLPVIRRGRLAKPARRWQAESGESPTGDFRPAKPGRYHQGVFHNDVIAVSNRQVLFCINRRSLDRCSYWQTCVRG